MRKDKIIKKMESDLTDNMSPLETELMQFIELVQSSQGFFDWRFLRVIKKNKKAYFEYGAIVKEFPLEYIEIAKNGGR